MEAAKGYPPPNFLILIGDRYGWVPLPYAIARDEFDALRLWLKDNAQEKSAHGLGTAYQHDENYLITPHRSPIGRRCADSTPDAYGAQAIALIREIGDHPSVSPEVMSRFVERDSDRKQRLDTLKDRIRTAMPEASLIKARATLHANGELDEAYLGRIAEQITAKLRAAVIGISLQPSGSSRRPISQRAPFSRSSPSVPPTAVKS